MTTTHRTVPVDAAQIVREEWHRAVRFFNLKPGSDVEQVVANILKRLSPPPSDLPQSLRDRVVEVLTRAETALRGSYDAQYHPADGQTSQDIAAREVASLLLELKERGDG